MNELDELTKLAMELQALAQGGLAYTKDIYDKGRFERIREISAELMSIKTGTTIEKVKELFCNETGYQTPKIDSRGVIFKDHKILLVKEKEKWALPGGWVDYDLSIAANVAKEVEEEAGLIVMPKRIIALQDRNKYNIPKHAYGICKVFVLCEEISGSFKENIETTESNYFSLENIPDLDEERTVYSQIKMCFDAYKNDKWQVLFD